MRQTPHPIALYLIPPSSDVCFLHLPSHPTPRFFVCPTPLLYMRACVMCGAATLVSMFSFFIVRLCSMHRTCLRIMRHWTGKTRVPAPLARERRASLSAGLASSLSRIESAASIHVHRLPSPDRVPLMASNVWPEGEIVVNGPRNVFFSRCLAQSHFRCRYVFVEPQRIDAMSCATSGNRPGFSDGQRPVAVY